MPDLAAGVFDLPTNFPVSRRTPELIEPLTLWTSQPYPDTANPRAYAPEGFEDVAGAELVISDASQPPTGGGSGGAGSGGNGSGGSGGNSSGSNAAGSNGSGGGGASGPAVVLTLVLLVAWRRFSQATRRP